MGSKASRAGHAGIRRILEVDEKERTVDLPLDFAKAMTPAERRVYDALAYSHRKEYVLWIEDAKRPETRLRRIEQARVKLRERLVRYS
jgi:uncharacterized protein YdeI (YjbR/CyaY-like superfamily)